MADKPPDPAELARFAEQAEKAIERLESRVGRRASKTVTDAIRPVIVEITRLWVAQFGSVTATADPARVAALMQAVRVLLAGLAADPSVPVAAVLDDALALGARNAFGLLGRVDVDLVPSAVLVDAVDAMADIVSEARDAAVERLDTVADWDGMVAVFGDLTRAEHRADAAAKWAVVRAVSEGTEQVAEAAGADMVWVAERDGACLECLAYQGHVVHAGERFPGGLTFRVSATPRFPESIPGPPRHPRCRCHLQCHRDEWTVAGVPSFPEVLVREAQRAVLRGDAGDSNHARLQAADALLAEGSDLPKTVKQRARRAVAAGEFPDRRSAREGS